MLEIILVFIIGACFGSFACVLAYRLTGMCRKCFGRMSILYPTVGLLCGALFAATVLIYGFPGAVPFLLMVFALLVITLVDLKTHEIPDSMIILIIFLAVFWIVAYPASINVKAAMIGAAAGAAPLFIVDRIALLILKKDGFGYGDMKLMGAAGLLIGWQGVLIAFFFAFITGAVAALYMLMTKKAKRGGYIAFGPFLSGGILIAAWSYEILGTHLLNFMILV